MSSSFLTLFFFLIFLGSGFLFWVLTCLFTSQDEEPVVEDVKDEEEDDDDDEDDEKEDGAQGCFPFSFLLSV